MLGHAKGKDSPFYRILDRPVPMGHPRVVAYKHCIVAPRVPPGCVSSSGKSSSRSICQSTAKPKAQILSNFSIQFVQPAYQLHKDSDMETNVGDYAYIAKAQGGEILSAFAIVNEQHVSVKIELCSPAMLQLMVNVSSKHLDTT